TFSGNFSAAWRTAATIALVLMLHLIVERMRRWGVYTFVTGKAVRTISGVDARAESENAAGYSPQHNHGNED
ncbi:MAG TPA: hypothetical protein VII29_18830, partial [Terriglobales bacterium]